LARLLELGMKISLELSRHRKARIWLDEVPPANVGPASLVTKMAGSVSTKEVAHRVVGVEISIPHGGKHSYALLGAEFSNTDEEGFEVVVPVSSYRGKTYTDPLVAKSEAVKVGLPAEYTEAVMSGTIDAALTFGAPKSGRLNYKWAAHASVSSSVSSFSLASRFVVRLLTLRSEERKDICALFE
jgi:hypothetical protein